jgi:hypothetical protein
MIETATRRKAPWLRYAVFILAGLEFAVFALIGLEYLVRGGSMDMITQSMSRDFAIVAAVPLVLLTLPALVLAFLNRWLVLGLILALLPVPLVVGFFALALN